MGLSLLEVGSVISQVVLWDICPEREHLGERMLWLRQWVQVKVVVTTMMCGRSRRKQFFFCGQFPTINEGKMVEMCGHCVPLCLL
jgi:hypothetical protein